MLEKDQGGQHHRRFGPVGGKYRRIDGSHQKTDHAGERRIARKGSDASPCSQQDNAGGPVPDGEDPDAGCHAFASLKIEIEGQQMPYDCGYAGTSSGMVGLVVIKAERRGNYALRDVSQEGEETRPATAQAQHIGGACIVGACFPRVNKAKKPRHQHGRGDGAHQIAQQPKQRSVDVWGQNKGDSGCRSAKDRRVFLLCEVVADLSTRYHAPFDDTTFFI